MRLIFILLYSLIFSFSSLYSATSQGYSIYGGYGHGQSNPAFQTLCESKHPVNSILYGEYVHSVTTDLTTDYRKAVCMVTHESTPLPICLDEDTILPLLQEMCSGTFNNADMGIKYGELYYQTCDSSCRGVFQSFYTCNELLEAHMSSCPKESNTLVFKCSEIDDGIGGIIPNLEEATCTPKTNPKTNPCDDLYQNTLSSCNMATHKVVGYPECTHNGMLVTNDTIKCVISEPETLLPKDCKDLWHEVLNVTSNACECKEGYERNSFGDCWKPLFPDNNSTTPEQKAQEQLEQDKNNKAKAKSEADSNSTTLSQLSNKNTNDTLSGIRKDLNNTNSILASINSKFDNNSSSSVSYTEDVIQKENRLAIDNVLTDLYDIIKDIKSDYKSIKVALDVGLVSPNLSNGTDPIFCAVVFNKNLCINLCDSFGVFYSIFYYIFVSVFMLASLRLYYTAFKMR